MIRCLFASEYYLERAGFEPGQKPDPNKLVFLPVVSLAVAGSVQSLLQRAGFPPGQKPDRLLIMESVGRMDKERRFGFIPPFPMPIHPHGWRCCVKRRWWGFFSSHCPGLKYVGNSESL